MSDFNISGSFTYLFIIKPRPTCMWVNMVVVLCMCVCVCVCRISVCPSVYHCASSHIPGLHVQSEALLLYGSLLVFIGVYCV